MQPSSAVLTLLALTACLPGLFLTSGQAGGASPCSNRIVGTSANDILPGTSGSDKIVGLAGRDRLTGAAAVDCLEGGPDDDILAGEAGGDRLDGNEGDDDLSGGEAADLLEGRAGDDSLAGEAGADSLHSGPGNDTLVEVGDGYRAGETIDAGSNVISAGPGSDTVQASNGRRDRINCGSGKDRAVVDRIDRLKGCERRSFLVSPLPEVSPDRGGRRRSFMVSFRSLVTTNRRTEFFSITIKGPRSCRRITSNSIGATYHRDRVVRYRVRPFSGAGRAAKRWCPGRYRGSASFVEIVEGGCKSRADREPDPDCTDARRIGEFSFRVR